MIKYVVSQIISSFKIRYTILKGTTVPKKILVRILTLLGETWRNNVGLIKKI